MEAYTVNAFDTFQVFDKIDGCVGEKEMNGEIDCY